jgi:hypothetical protein
MSTSTPASVVQLPPGVVVQPGRETSQVNSQGQIEQGMVFPITLPSGSTTSVFIPYSAIHDTAYVQQVIAERVNAIMAISG